MKRRKFSVSKLLAGGVLAIGFVMAPFAAQTVGAMQAPVASADSCISGGGGVLGLGGGYGSNCDTWTPAHNHVMCAYGGGGGLGFGGGGGSCRIEWGGDPGNFVICNVIVDVNAFVHVHTENHDCPFVP